MDINEPGGSNMDSGSTESSSVAELEAPSESDVALLTTKILLLSASDRVFIMDFVEKILILQS